MCRHVTLSACLRVVHVIRRRCDGVQRPAAPHETGLVSMQRPRGWVLVSLVHMFMSARPTSYRECVSLCCSCPFSQQPECCPLCVRCCAVTGNTSFRACVLSRTTRLTVAFFVASCLHVNIDLCRHGRIACVVGAVLLCVVMCDPVCLPACGACDSQEM